MDTLKLGLGHIIEPNRIADRDAIHIAIAPVCAGEALSPGQRVELKDGNAVGSLAGIGVVDPFLSEAVNAGQRFWLYLAPGTITGLRHIWSHPNFASDGTAVSSEHEKWLRDFAYETGADYEQMMEVAASHCTDSKWGGDYLCEGGRWEGQNTPDEFWEHFTAVTGKSPNTTYGLPGIFSCSC